MRRLALIPLLCLGLIAPYPAVALDLNAPIPACTEAQRTAAWQVMETSGVLEEVSALARRLDEAAPSDFGAIAADLNRYQARWWIEVAPVLPDCALAVNATHRVGRVIDELLFVVTMTQIAINFDALRMPTSSALFTEIARGHVETFMELSQDILASTNALSAGD